MSRALDLRLFCRLLLGLLLVANAAARLWTSTDGRTVEAELEFADASSVTILRIEDERSFTIERAFLSDCDQAYVEGWLAGNADSAPPALQPDGLSDDPFSASDPSNRTAILHRYQRELRPLDFNWRQVGSILEGLGYLELQRRYPPPAFAIFHSLQYHDASGRTLGEIDLLVFDRKRGQVVAVYECKISSQPPRALKHAERQLERFQNALHAREVARFTLTSEPSRPFSADEFEALEDFRTIGGEGTERLGYDLEIDLSRDEADVLQAMLLSQPSQ